MGGKKKALLITLYFQSTLQTSNLNTFVFENDFEYSPFSRLISFNSCQALSIVVGCSNRLHNPYKVRKCPQFNVLTIKHTKGFQRDYIKRTSILKKLYVLVPFDKDNR